MNTDTEPGAGHSIPEVLTRLVGESRLDVLLELLLDQVRACGDFPGCNVMFLTADREHLQFERMRLPPGYERLESVYLHRQVPVEHDELAARALAEERAVCLQPHDLQHLAGDSRTRMELMRVSAIASLPLRGREQSRGVLTVYTQTGEIDPDSLDRLQARADLITPQLEIALAVERVQRRELDLQAALRKQQDFLRFINTVNDLTTASEIYDAIAQGFMGLFAFDLAGFALREGDELLVKRVVLGNPAYADRYPALNAFYLSNRYPLDLGGGGLAVAFQQDAPLVFPDIQVLGDIPMIPKDKQALELMRTPRTFLMTPIRRQGVSLGVLWLASLGEPVKLSDADLRLVDLLSTFVGTAIGNAQLYGLVARQNQAIEELNDKLKRQVHKLATEASTDKLTGLHNFAYFEGEIRRRIAEYQRSPQDKPLALALIDVDHFKRFNDHHGHVAGNAVLQEVARRIASAARKMDIPCRYGGEEFVVILPVCDLDGAYGFAERLRNEVSGTPFFVDGQYLHLTISAGCAVCRAEETPAEFIARADRALYAAKEAGRNRVEREAPVSPAPPLPPGGPPGKNG